MTSQESPEFENLIGDLENNLISRRQFVMRATALGLSLPAISGILASSGFAATRRRAVGAIASAPRVGGTLREGYDLDFSRMDPINTSWYDPGFFALYEALITLDPKARFVPQLAQSWTVSRDGKTWTFKIRKGAKFHSGAPVTAASIAAVYNTIINPKSGSPQIAMWAPVIKSVAKGQSVLQIQLKHPYANLPNVLATGYSRIVNMVTRTKLGAVDYGKKVIDGSGPFSFVEWVPGDHVSVKRWDGYPGSITPFFRNKGKAYLDGINWRYIQEAASRALAIENGELDALHGPAPQDISRLKGNSNMVVTQLGEESVWFMGLNFDRLEFKDVRIRQAVSHAIDRNAIVQKLVFGYGTPAFGPLPTSDPTYYKAVQQFNNYDVEKSKSLLTAAGWTAGSDGILAKGGQKFSFELAVTNESFSTQLASVLQAALKQIGMDVKVNAYDRATHFSKLGTGVDSFTFKYLWPNPYDVYIVLTSSSAIPVPNWEHARLPDLDAAHAKFQSARTPAQLLAASRNGQMVGAEQLPFVPIFTPANVWVNTKKVHGYLPLPWNLYPYYNDVWLES
jgi:peptide/nickel transport system substrate-binding protein